MSQKNNYPILLTALRTMARLTIKRYTPIIIGVTGSVGKTSTKNAIHTLLDGDVNVRKSQQNQNTDIGVALTIVGATPKESRSLVEWFGIGIKWVIKMIVSKKYPEVLVMEMGIDQPGDMEEIVKIAPASIAVVTEIPESPAHLSSFKSVAQVANEKSKMVAQLPKEGVAILNADNSRVMRMSKKTDARIITYGIENPADVMAQNISISIKGTTFKLVYDGKTIPVHMPKVVSYGAVSTTLAAIAATIALKQNIVTAIRRLESFSLENGRMNLLSGKNQTTIIDDSYNAQPDSVENALLTMEKIAGEERKIVILGDMLELGKNEEKEHMCLAEKIIAIDTACVVTIGRRMRLLVETIQKKAKEKIIAQSCRSHEEVIEKVKRCVKPGSIILVKGSQAMRMEKVVEALIANPEQKEALLCRQGELWQEREYKEP
ncbi:MAG: hypothetical protein KC736_04650 [Candidatus Moranbacteria bacterium]|nr:hypothetical protein [Candidatus Moranbacteria bacterium]